MRNLILLLSTILLVVSCKKDKGSNPPPGNLNPWDGRYRIEGTMIDHADPSFEWAGDTYIYSLQTSGANTDSVISENLGMPGHLIKNGINLSYYSNFGLIVTFDAATNKVTAVTNYYGQPSSNGRSAVLDPSGVNAVDPATKTIKIKYWMDEVGTPGHRASFDETWVYIGPR